MSTSFLANLLLVKMGLVAFTFAIILMNSMSSCGTLLDSIGSARVRGPDYFIFDVGVSSGAGIGGAIDWLNTRSMVDSEETTYTFSVVGTSLD